MNKNNIFTQENYAFLCQDHPYSNPEKLNRRKYLHIPQITKPSCKNLHKIVEIKPFNHYIRRKEAIFHQIMVSHKQLDNILHEIGEKEVKKKAEPGSILNLNRKKIYDIINIYSEVLKFKDNFINKEGSFSNEKSSINEEKAKENDKSLDSPHKLLRKRQSESEEMKELREINRKLVGMVSTNQKRIYGKEKYNQDKAKFLFENNSFFIDLVSEISSSEKDKKSFIKSPKTLKTERKTKEKPIIAQKRRSLSEYIPLNKQELDEREKVLKEINGLSEELPSVVINEKTGDFDFNEIKSSKQQKNLDFFNNFHENSAWNSVFQRKNQPENLIEEKPLVIKKKRAISFSGENKSFFREISQNPKVEIVEIRKILKEEKIDCKDLKQKLRQRKKNYSKSLNRLDKQLSRLI